MEQEKKQVSWRALVAGVLGALVLIVALQNSQRVEVDVLMVNLTAPLIVVILVAAGVGAVVGYVAPLIRRHHREGKELASGDGP
jgi:uncharacterized integral membrane protein